jgi:hypothetical protein
LLEERRCGHTWKVRGSGTGDKSVVVRNNVRHDPPFAPR